MNSISKNAAVKSSGFITPANARLINDAIDNASSVQGINQLGVGQRSSCVAVITAIVAAGVYTAKIIQSEINGDSTSALNVTGLASRDYATVFNLAEDVAGPCAGQNVLAVGCPVPCIYFGRKSTGEPALATFAGGGISVVKVYQDGGTAGSSSATCDYTYTIKDMDGTTLATSLLPSKARLPTCKYTKAPDNSYGLAANISGWVLLDALAEHANTVVDEVTFITAIECNGDGTITPTPATYTFVTLEG